MFGICVYVDIRVWRTTRFSIATHKHIYTHTYENIVYTIFEGATSKIFLISNTRTHTRMCVCISTYVCVYIYARMCVRICGCVLVYNIVLSLVNNDASVCVFVFHTCVCVCVCAREQ